MTWQAHGDPMMWVAGVRALCLQALHPRAVRGVMRNSDFRKDAWGRLMRTVHFLATTAYGNTPLWAHCAEIDSCLHILRRSGYPITGAHADRYIREHLVSARLVGLDPADVPADRAEPAASFRKVRPEAAAGAEAHEVDDFTLRPPTHPLLVPAREVLWRRVAQPAYASLPPYAHELYGRAAPEPPTVTRQSRALGTLPRCVPARVRWQLPPKHILRAVSRVGPGSYPAPYKLGR